MTETEEETKIVDLMMPRRQYDEDRRFAFDMLARHAETDALNLRVGLSNVFVSMARQGRPRPT